MKTNQIRHLWNQYKRWQKQNHMAPCTLEEFTRYVRGQDGLGCEVERGEYRPPRSAHDDRLAANRAIPSRSLTGSGVCARVESPRYTGTYVKGVGTMHKSNAVPIVDDEHRKDIARMRR